MEISPKNGFKIFPCEKGVSSEVLTKDNYVFKINTRNSVKRTNQDYAELRKIFSAIKHLPKLQKSKIFSCKYRGKPATCVQQKIIKGKTIADLGKPTFKNYLLKNPQEILFLKRMIKISLARLQTKQLFPDLVGHPADQSLWKAINLMLDKKRGLVLCDIGLAPHEETIKRLKNAYFTSANAKRYKQKMIEALNFLNNL